MLKLVSISIFYLLFSQSYKEKCENIIRSIFPKSKKLIYQNFRIPKEEKKHIQKKVRQSFFRSNLYTWKIELSDDSIHYGVLDNVIGKVQPITFMVIYEENGTIDFVEVMKYREAYGYEISRSTFRKQFEGKTEITELRVGVSIKNISGATISVRALSKGVQKLTLLFPIIKKSFLDDEF